MSFMYATEQDTPIQKKKPAKKEYNQDANGVPVHPPASFGTAVYSDVIQRIKIKGEYINLADGEIEQKYKAALKENVIVNKNFEKFKFNGSFVGKDTFVDNCYKFAKENLNNPSADQYVIEGANKTYNLKFKDDQNAINRIASIYVDYLNSHKENDNIPDNTNESMPGVLRYGYFLNRKSFSGKDIRMIMDDPMFMEIREMQEEIKGHDSPEEENIDIRGLILENDPKRINMDKLRYKNFYSRSAMRDEVKRYLIDTGRKHGGGKTQEDEDKGGREASLYKPDLQDEIFQNIYDDHTIHHIRPLRQLTEEYEETDTMTLQEYQWQLDNLVLGPTNTRRIYEPGDMFDIEAHDVTRKTFLDTPVTIDTEGSGKVKSGKRMRMESPRAAMRTDYLQYFYDRCRKYFEWMSSKDYGKQDTSSKDYGKQEDAPPRDLLTIAQTLLYRFHNIEIRHRDEKLLHHLHKFVEAFRDNEGNDTIRLKVTEGILVDLIKYGWREDAREEQAQEEFE